MTASRVQWQDAQGSHEARWQSEAGVAPPARLELADERLPADVALRKMSEGTALLWQGDYHQARQLLSALAKRIDARAERSRSRQAVSGEPAAAFHQHRMRQAQRARTLGLLLIPMQPGLVIPLKRAPDVHEACAAANIPNDEACVLSLRELLGVIGAWEWRKRGVPVPALNDVVHPHYGVFAPVRSEYVELVARAALPASVRTKPEDAVAFDIGTGTGVLAAVLARRGIGRVVASELDVRALACARENLARMQLLEGVSPAGRVTVLQADLFPSGEADIVLCNPPWVPAKATSALERAVYDDGGRMLAGYLAGLAGHLKPGGEGWLIISDLAEPLGLRTRAAFLQQMEAAGLVVLGREDARPTHPKSQDADDPLARARRAEVTSLWRLGCVEGKRQ